MIFCFLQDFQEYQEKKERTIQQYSFTFHYCFKTIVFYNNINYVLFTLSISYFAWMNSIFLTQWFFLRVNMEQMCSNSCKIILISIFFLQDCSFNQLSIEKIFKIIIIFTKLIFLLIYYKNKFSHMLHN